MLKSNTIYALSRIINLTGQRISKREILTFNQSTPIRKKKYVCADKQCSQYEI